MPKQRIYAPEVSAWRRKHSISRAQAKLRKEEWAFTFETWFSMWDVSGVKDHRGNKPHQYCMVRLDNIEAWGPHNCIIVGRRMHLKKQAYETMHNFPVMPWETKHGV
jgi:hypothetical protein|tara:strand:- start:603 stop:923 length:321 start_codon:yes stop_codon:yes gene_type:complete